MSETIPVHPTRYRLTVYAPDQRHEGAHFMSKTPFQPMKKGDLVLGATWNGTDYAVPSAHATFVVAEVTEVLRLVQLLDAEIVDAVFVYTKPLPPSPR